MGTKKQFSWKKLSLCLFSLLLVAALAIGMVLVCNYQEEKELEELQNEALQMLLEREGEYDEHSIVLQNTTHSEAQQLADRFGAKLRITENGRFATLTLPEEVTIRDIYALRENREYIEAMSPDFQAKTSDLTEEELADSKLPTVARPQFTVADSGYSSQTYLDYLNLQRVWETTRGSGITVAVIDTGIDTDHPEFAGKVSEYSYNASEDKIVKDYILADGSYDWSLIEDKQGHGTGVSGVIAASMNNEEGIVGLAPEVTIIVIKAECDANGTFKRSSDLVFGLYYAIERDVNVVNMSFGGRDNPYAEPALLAVDSDIICVAAAGNDSTAQLTYPAADENVIGVGALADGSWELADYSNYGENVNIVAPGSTYTTKMGGSYGTMNGTSLACPTAVGAIALYLSQNQYSTFESVAENLYASTYDLGDLGNDWYFGYGALDIHALVQEKRGKVTFNMLTDELDNTEQLFVRNHTLQNIPEPERTYAVFDGWYYDIDCTEPLNLYADAFSADLTLYASWVNEDDGVPYTYVELDDGTIEIRSYTGKRRYITIPDTIDGKVVSSIGDFAFYGESRLHTVNLPAGLVNLGWSAFQNCNNLISITIPDGVTEIKANSFMSCIRLSAIEFGANSQLQYIGVNAFAYCSHLKRFELPANVRALSGCAFAGDASLTAITVQNGNISFASVDGVLFNYTRSTLVVYPAGRSGEYALPAGVTEIGGYAFAHTRLKTLALDGVHSIGAYAFAGSALESVILPDSVNLLGKGAFESSAYLKTATLGSGLTTISAEAFKQCSKLDNVVIPANVRSIGMCTFAGTESLQNLMFTENSQLTQIDRKAFCSSALKQIDFPASLISIGNEAFYQNKALASVTFGEGSSLQAIGNMAFFDTTFLTAISLPENLRQIGDYAFQNSALTEIAIPASVSYLGIGTFASCHSLANVFVDDANTSYIDIDGVVYNPDKTVIVAYPAGNTRTSYTVESTVTEIGDAAFYGSHNLTSISLPNGLITVGEYCFYDCCNITGYSLPSTLTYIEQYAFSYNTALLSLDIPDKVYQISKYAFAYDSNLHYINFTENATLPRISYAAFAYTGLYSFRVPASVSTMAQNAFIGSPYLTSFTFAAGSKLESISAYMFKGCESLRGITFESGSKLASIQAHGFEGMTKLQSIDFGDAKLTNIDNYAFRYCESLATLPIPEGVDYIGRYAFYGCKALTRLYIPASIDFIGENAFYFAENLDIYFAADSLPANLAERWDNGIRGYYVGVKNVIENDEWRYAELNGGGVSIIEYKGSATTLDLTAIDFGREIVSIGGYAFYGADLTSITLPATLQEIHRYSFAFTKFQTINIPDSVAFIGQYAFLSTAVESVTFGNATQINNIEQYAFTNCKKLQNFKLPASLTTLGRYAFSKSGLTSVDFTVCTLTKFPEGAFMGTKLTSVTLPNSLSLIDHNAFRDCERLASVTFGSSELQLMSNVFYNTGLSTVNIPDNLTYIGEYSLVGLKNLTAFAVSSTHPKYIAIDGLLYSKDGRKLIAAPAGRSGEITLPQSLEILGFGAFENSQLTKIHFHPESNILTFGYRCFYNSAITELNVPRTVVAFDFYAFAMCKNLTTVTFAEENNLKGIYEGAFYGCLNLHNIVIPDSIVEISDYAFYGCTSLEKLPFAEAAEIKGIYDYAFAYTSFESITLPDTLLDIGNYAFCGTRLKSVTVPDANKELLIIGIGAFADCNQMEEIALPFIGASFEDYDITWFGYIFGAGRYEANNAYVPDTLKKVTISEGISFIGKGAFYGVRGGLEWIELPHSVTAVYSAAFLDTVVRYELTNQIMLYYVQTPECYGTNYYFGQGISRHLTLAKGIATYDIAHQMFWDCPYIEKVAFSEGITAIPDTTFYNCKSLIHVSIPNSVTIIEDGAFEKCSALEKLVLPDGLTSIGERAFYNCTNLKKINIPNGVTKIESYTFAECHSLQNIILPNGVAEIGSQAFQSCRALTSIVLPLEIASIGEYAFSDCNLLYEVINHSSLILQIGSYDFGRVAAYARVLENADGSRQFLDDSEFSYVDTADGFRFTCINQEYTLVAYLGDEDTVTLPANIYGKSYKIDQMKGGKNIILPDSFKKINSTAFYYNNTIESVILSDQIETIERYAFGYCTNLKSIVLTDQISQIEDGAFYGCRSLVHIEIPEKVTRIEWGTFVDCTSLESVILPDGLTYIGDSAFSRCQNLKTINLPQTVSYIGEEALAGTAISDINLDPQNQSFVDIEGVLYDRLMTKIVFVSNQVSNLLIPASVQNLSGAFYENKTIQSVSFDVNSSISVLEPFAFHGCSALMQVELPPALTIIEEYGFTNCKNLQRIQLPQTGMTKIGLRAFEGCANLISINLYDGIVLGDEAFHGCKSLKNIYIPAGVTTIPHRLFFECSGLQTVSIPETVTVIGTEAFAYCYSLTNIQLPAGLERIDGGAFHFCDKIESLVIPDSVTFIGESAFSSCSSLKAIQLPSGVTSIEPRTFQFCEALEDIILPENVTSIGESAFDNCILLKNIALSEKITAIGAYAFSMCRALNKIVLPSHFISIEPGTFYGCGGLCEFDFPDGLISIGENAFGYCTGLITLELPTQLTAIGNEAFFGCENLKQITNLSQLELTFESSDHGYIAYYANALVLADGKKVCKEGNDFRFIDTEDQFRFAYYDGKYWLLAYLGDAETITLPDSIEGRSYSVRRLSGTFKHVIIPYGTTIIGFEMFYGNANLESVQIPETVTTIDSGAFMHCNRLKQIDIPESVRVIGDCAFYGCRNLAEVNIAGTGLMIGTQVFDFTWYYDHIAQWDNGCLYVGDILVAVSKDVEVLVTRPETRGIASDAFNGCYYLRVLTISGNYLGCISQLTNLGTLILTDMPAEQVYVAAIPLTLKNVILKKDVIIRCSSAFANFYHIVIYAEIEKINTQWDHDYKGWNSQNAVYYGESWINAEFFDANGVPVSFEYYLNTQIIRQPMVENIVDGERLKVFVGWDLDGDGIADFMPATSASDIHAIAVYKTHRPGKWTKQVSTCTEDGYRQQVCLDCGEVLNHKLLPKLEHTSAGLVQAIAPTCTEDGYELHTCAICGEQYRTAFVPATDHSFGEWTIETEATCTETGLQSHICTVCTHREETLIPASGHSYTAEVTKEATCTKQGEISYTCAHCSDAVTEATETVPHNYEKKYASESFLRWLIEHLLDIFFGYEGENGYYFECTECHHIQTYEDALSFGAATAGSACQHQLGEWAEVLGATCTDSGIEMCSCLLCGEGVEARNMNNALGDHILVSHNAKTPTCTEIGWNAYEDCTRCDYTTYSELAALGHTPATAVVENRVEPTCTVAGHYDSVVYCSVCNEELSRDAKTIDVLGHDKVQHTAKAPTCTEIGWNAYEDCSRCDYTTYSELAALGHDFSLEKHDATYHWTKCSRCDAIDGKATHSGGTATCTKQSVCQACGTAYGALLNHAAGEWKEVIAPQIGQAGREELHCRDCDVVMDAREIPALPEVTTSATTAPDEPIQTAPIDPTVTDPLESDDQGTEEEGCASAIDGNIWFLFIAICSSIVFLYKKKKQM